MPAAETILCVAIAASRLRAGDLAAAVPALAALPPDRVLGWTPSPGARRWLHPAEWRRWLPAGAAASAAGGTVCVERATAPPERAAVEDALRSALSSGLRFELMDWARAPLPAGRLAFDQRVLPQPPPGAGGRARAVVWRGGLEDGEGHRYPFWVRARVFRLEKSVRARERLPAGIAPLAAQLEESAQETAVGAPVGYQSIADAVGCKPRRAIAAGESIDAVTCPAPRGVEAGGEVMVVARAGSASLAMQARAQTGGPPGAWIWLENPANRRRFRARVTGRGQAETGGSGARESGSDERPPDPGLVDPGTRDPGLVDPGTPDRASTAHGARPDRELILAPTAEASPLGFALEPLRDPGQENLTTAMNTMSLTMPGSSRTRAVTVAPPPPMNTGARATTGAHHPPGATQRTPRAQPARPTTSAMTRTKAAASIRPLTKTRGGNRP